MSEENGASHAERRLTWLAQGNTVATIFLLSILANIPDGSLEMGIGVAQIPWTNLNLPVRAAILFLSFGVIAIVSAEIFLTRPKHRRRWSEGGVLFDCKEDMRLTIFVVFSVIIFPLMVSAFGLISLGVGFGYWKWIFVVLGLGLTASVPYMAFHAARLIGPFATKAKRFNYLILTLSVLSFSVGVAVFFIVLSSRSINLIATNLRGSVFVAGSDLSGAVFAQANLRSAVLDSLILRRANFAEADLTQVSFRGSNLTEADLRSNQIARADFGPLPLEQRQRCPGIIGLSEGARICRTVLTRARINGADLGGSDLRNVVAFGLEMRNAEMGGTDLARAVLDHAVAHRVRLYGSNLTGASFRNATLIEANFSGSEFIGADFHAADIRGADLNGARNLTQEQLNNALGDCSTSIPAGLVRPRHWGACLGREEGPP